MKAERFGEDFVPVTVTLESQEEVDALFVLGNDTRICDALPALDGMWDILRPFTGNDCSALGDKLDSIID